MRLYDKYLIQLFIQMPPNQKYIYWKVGILYHHNITGCVYISFQK